MRAADLFNKFELGAAEIDNFEPRVSDDELKAGYFMIVGAFSRVAPKEGSVYTSPQDTWHGYGEIRPDKWLQRTVKGRAHLNSLMVSQVEGHGLAFLNVDTGEVERSVTKPGKFNLVDRHTAVPVLLALSMSISKDKGREAGKGQAFHYVVNGGRLSIEKAVSKAPELPLAADMKQLPVSDVEPDDDQEGEPELAEVGDAPKAKASRSKKR